MNYIIDKKSSIPAYIQLYRHLVNDIVAGIYPYGSKLPSKRTITQETDISIITVQHAIEILCEEGYIESRPRSGYYITYRKKDFLSTGEDTYGKSVRAAEAVNLVEASFPYSVIAKTIRRVVLDYQDRLLVRTPGKGCMELRNEICRYLGRSRGISIRPEQVVIGAGAEYLYGLIVQLLGRDRVIAIEDPSYEKISQVYSSMGVKIDPLKLGKSGISAEELGRTQATVLHVTPFNSYPSGITVSISKKHEYINWARERNGYIVEDNYDSELTVSTKAEVPLFSLDKKANVIYLNTFSRTIAPSVRVGYMILPEGLVEEFDNKLGFYSCTVPVLDQFILAELMEKGDYERHINRVRRKRRKEA